MNEEQVFANGEKNLKYLNEHFHQLETKYPNRFVAISNGEIVAVGDTPDAIFEIMDEKGIDRANVLIEFIPMAGSILIL